MDLPEAKQRAVRQVILDWYRCAHRELPWRHTRDPYSILVSEIMLQQTQVDRVLPRYQEWLTRYPTLAALAAAPRADVIRAWAGLGYNLRAVRLHEIARQVVERFDGRLPDTEEGLLSLKGIGRYTAGAVLCFAHGQAAPVLDTNVRRVLGRIFAEEAPTAIEDDRVAWPLAAAALPESPADAYDWNQALMDVGATLCLSRNPRCLLCPAQTECTARKAWFAPDGSEATGSPVSLSMVAEDRAGYAAAAKRRKPAATERFEGSRRWYRGRIVDALRDRPAGLTVIEIAQHLEAEEALMMDLVEALARDGLAVLSPSGVVTLPKC